MKDSKNFKKVSKNSQQNNSEAVTNENDIYVQKKLKKLSII